MDVLYLPKRDYSNTDAAVNLRALEAWAENIVGHETDTSADPHTQYLKESDLVFTRKTADESVTSSAVLQNDNHLTFAIGSSEVWVVDYMLAVTGAATGDFQMALAAPAGATGRRFRLGPETASSNVGTTLIQASGQNDLTTALGFGVDGTRISTIWVRAIVVNSTTAGNVVLQWAQLNSDVTATTVHTNSFLSGRKVA